MSVAIAKTLESAIHPEGPAWHTVGPDEVLSLQHVDARTGLTTQEADSRRVKYGANRLTEAKKEPRWRAFLRQYTDPMQIVLVVAGVLSFYPVKQYGTALVIFGLTL